MTCAALVRSQRAAQPIPLGKDGGWQQHWAFVHHGSDDCQVSRWKRVENIGWLVGWFPWNSMRPNGGSDSKAEKRESLWFMPGLGESPDFTSTVFFVEALGDLQLISYTLQCTLPKASACSSWTQILYSTCF